MSSSRKIWFAILVCVFAAAGVNAQAEEESVGPKFTWPAVPYSPNEPVTGPLQTLTSPQDRAMAMGLLERASQNYRFYVPRGAPFTMHVTFLASGQSQIEGQGSMEETWLDGSHRRWTAELNGNVSGRSAYGNRLWATGGSQTIPLRVQMVRSALFWPVSAVADRAELRMQKVNFQGSALTCILTSGKINFPPEGRHWVETEYCVDEQTGLLRVWSKAPGIYAVYDYRKTISWSGHQIASQITFHEGTQQVLQIHVDNLGEATVNPDSFRPPPEILIKQNAAGNAGPVRFALIVSSGGRPLQGAITPVIVHASVGADGKIVDAEVITQVDASLAERALAEVKAHSKVHMNANEQTEALISVEFISGKG